MPEVRAGLIEMLPRGGIAALDFDDTCIRGDISETLLALLAAERSEDLVGAYESACLVDRRAAYIELVHTLVAGRTESEARALALRAFGAGQREGRIAIRESVRELVWALHRHGWQVWVVTASPEVLVQALAERYGMHPDRVIGMRSVVDSDGRYLAEVADPVTYREGKVEAIRAASGSDPTFAAGDSDSDAPLLAAARYALLVDRGGDVHLRDRAARAGWWIQPAELLQ